MYLCFHTKRSCVCVCVLLLLWARPNTNQYIIFIYNSAKCETMRNIPHGRPAKQIKKYICAHISTHTHRYIHKTKQNCAKRIFAKLGVLKRAHTYNIICLNVYFEVHARKFINEYGTNSSICVIYCIVYQALFFDFLYSLVVNIYVNFCSL